MTRGKISLGRAWYSRVFPGWAGPEEVDDVAIATLPIGGAGRYNDLQFEGIGVTNGIQATLATVGDDVQRWVPWLEGYHSDSTLQTHLRIILIDRGNNEVTLVSGGNITEDLHISVRRPIIVQAGWKLRVVLSATTAGGAAVKIRCFYVETPIGEYVAPL